MKYVVYYLVSTSRPNQANEVNEATEQLHDLHPFWTTLAKEVETPGMVWYIVKTSEFALQELGKVPGYCPQARSHLTSVT